MSEASSLCGSGNEPTPPRYRTWKDGINEQPVCVICQFPPTSFDHGVCAQIAAGRGYFGQLFVRPEA